MVSILQNQRGLIQATVLRASTVGVIRTAPTGSPGTELAPNS
jgi:hypothetical protein